jgi:hypothetical protein
MAFERASNRRLGTAFLFDPRITEMGIRKKASWIVKGTHCQSQPALLPGGKLSMLPMHGPDRPHVRPTVRRNASFGGRRVGYYIHIELKLSGPFPKSPYQPC